MFHKMFKLLKKDIVEIDGKEYVSVETLRKVILGFKTNIHDENLDVGLSEGAVINDVNIVFSVLDYLKKSD